MADKPKRKLFISNEEAAAAEPTPAALDPQTAAPPLAPANFVTLRLDAVDESPTNPRKDFDKIALAELAADITRRGVLQPVLVRPVGERFELVFGHRRFRAAKMAGLEEVPALVRVLSDGDALEAQLVENLKRDDLSPLELANGYSQLMEKQQLSVDQLAEKVGKSRASVYGTLKLLELTAEARKVLDAGEISASVAQLVARVPASLQGRALAEVRGNTNPNRFGETSEPLSFRTAQRELTKAFTRDLKKAPFDTEDAALCPTAGACAACPKRSGNQPDLFDDLKKSPDVCTDVPCFLDKVRATAEVKLAKKGLQLLSRKESEQFIEHGRFYVDEHKTGYVDPSHQDYDDSKYRHHRELLQPEQYKELVRVVVLDDGTEHEVLPRKGLAAAKKKAGLIKSRPERSSSSTSSSPSKPKEYKPAEPTLEEKQLDAGIAALVAAVEKKGLLPKLVRLILCETLPNTEHVLERRRVKRVGYGTVVDKDLDKLFDNPKPAKLVGLLFETVLLDRAFADGYGIKDGPFTDAAELLGVDLKKVAKEVEAAEAAKTVAVDAKKPTAKSKKKAA